MITRPPSFMCFNAACVATIAARTFRLNIKSISSKVASSNGFGIAVPALFTKISRRPNFSTVFATDAFTAAASSESA